MHQRRIFSLLVVFSLLIVGIGAVSAQDPVSLDFVIAASPAELDAVQAQVDLFTAANPNITVSVTALPEYDTQIQAAFASGDYPNVFYVGQGNFQAYAQAGVILPAEGMIDMSGIYQSLQDTFTYDEQIYCPAKDFSLLALEYNKDMFDAAGLEYPTADWTWDDLAAAAEALTTDEVVGFVVNPDIDRWLSYYVQAGGSLYDEDGAFAFEEEAAIEAADFFATLFANGSANTSAGLGAGWPGEAFGKGQAAMTIEGNWMIGYMLEQFPDVNWGVAEMPAGPAGKGTLTFTVCLAVGNSGSDAEKAAAFQLVDFLTNAEGSILVAESGFGPIPSRPDGAEIYVEYWVERFAETGTDAASFANFIAGAEYAVAPILPVGFSEFRDALGNALNELISGNFTSQDVVDEAASVVEDLLDE